MHNFYLFRIYILHLKCAASGKLKVNYVIVIIIMGVPVCVCVCVKLLNNLHFKWKLIRLTWEWNEAPFDYLRGQTRRNRNRNRNKTETNRNWNRNWNVTEERKKQSWPKIKSLKHSAGKGEGNSEAGGGRLAALVKRSGQAAHSAA